MQRDSDEGSEDTFATLQPTRKSTRGNRAGEGARQQRNQDQAWVPEDDENEVKQRS